MYIVVLPDGSVTAVESVAEATQVRADYDVD